jgi:hypothetical protein
LWLLYAQPVSDFAGLQRPRGQQKRGKRSRHGKQITRLHRKVARQAKDYAHKLSSKIVKRYQRIAIGDVGTQVMRGTRIGMLRGFVQYKCQQAGRSFIVVSEQLTTQACSHCGSLSGPQGVSMLSVRHTHVDVANCAQEHLRPFYTVASFATIQKLRGGVQCDRHALWRAGAARL